MGYRTNHRRRPKFDGTEFAPVPEQHKSGHKSVGEFALDEQVQTPCGAGVVTGYSLRGIHGPQSVPLSVALAFERTPGALQPEVVVASGIRGKHLYLPSQLEKASAAPVATETAL